MSNMELGALAKANIKRGEGKKADAQQNEKKVEHGVRRLSPEIPVAGFESAHRTFASLFRWMGEEPQQTPLGGGGGRRQILQTLHFVSPRTTRKMGQKNKKGGRKERNHRRNLRMGLRSFRPPLGLAAIDLKSFQIAALLPGNQNWKFKL